MEQTNQYTDEELRDLYYVFKIPLTILDDRLGAFIFDWFECIVNKMVTVVDLRKTKNNIIVSVNLSEKGVEFYKGIKKQRDEHPALIIYDVVEIFNMVLEFRECFPEEKLDVASDIQLELEIRNFILYLFKCFKENLKSDEITRINYEKYKVESQQKFKNF
jgi:hypothetical protein